MTPKKIELSGAVTMGLCEVKSPVCVAAQQPQAVYIVWEMPDAKQVVVCGACMTAMFKSGSWQQTPPKGPKLDLASLGHAVAWAAIPQNMGTRAEMVGYLKKEIASGQNPPSVVEQLRAWVKQLEAVANE
jgi:hypothetical protein